jgi:HK97 gp10 family phage protein
MPGRSIFRAELHGAKELEAALNALPKRIGKAAVRRALLKAGKPIAADAAARVAVRSGKLKRTIRVSTQLSKRQRRGRARGAVKGRVDVYIGAGPSRHAHLVEFGTAPRQQRNGKQVGAVAAQPFMRPAWEAGKGRALNSFSKMLWEEIEKAVKRLAKKAAKG